MKRLLAAMRLEASLYYRTGFWLAALVAAGLAGVATLAGPEEARDRLLSGALLAYALFCGFGFDGYRMLRDRRDGVLEALDMSPLRPLESLASRIAVLAALSVPGALLAALVGRGIRFQPLLLAAGMGAGTALAALAGVLAAASHRAGPRFALWSVVYVLALAAPLFPGAGRGDEGAPARMLWHPMHGPMTLLEGAFARRELRDAALGLGIALLWAGAALVLCKRALGRLRERGGP